MRNLEDLSAQDLLVPIRGADPDRAPPEGLDVDELSGGPGDPVRPVVVDEEGRSTMPLFTSADAARRWRPSVSALSARGDRLLAMADRMGVAQVVVDPADPSPTRLLVTEGRAADPPGEGSWRVRAMAGPVEPGAMHRLRRLLAASPAVASAHLVEVTDPRTRRDMLMVALEVPAVSDPAAEGVARDLLPGVLSFLPGRLYDGIQVAVIADPTFRDEVRRADRPVYERP
jgi:hypothetical protein